MADCKIADCGEHEWDAVVIPGGMPGATHLKDNTKLEEIIKKQVIRYKASCPAVYRIHRRHVDNMKIFEKELLLEQGSRCVQDLSR